MYQPQQLHSLVLINNLGMTQTLNPLCCHKAPPPAFSVPDFVMSRGCGVCRGWRRQKPTKRKNKW